MTTVSDTPGSLFKIELLNANNWLAWKRRIMAVLRDRNLDEYVTGDIKCPVPTHPSAPTQNERDAIKAWKQKDQRAQTQIELSIGDAEMIHISGATTSAQMWTQL